MIKKPLFGLNSVEKVSRIVAFFFLDFCLVETISEIFDAQKVEKIKKTELYVVK